MPDAQPVAPAAAAAPPPPAAPAAAAPAAPATAPASPSAAEPVKPAAAAPAAETPPAAASAPAAQPPAPAAKTEPDKGPAPAVEIELKLPEGAKYDPAAIGEFKKIFADEKMTPAQRAQAVLDLDRRTAQAQEKAFKEKVEALRKADIETLKADKEFGGERYDKTVARAQSAFSLSKHGENFGKLLRAAGLDNHPDAVRFFADLRSKFSEDTTSSRAPGSQPTPADAKPMSRHQRWKSQYLPAKK